VGSEVAFIDMCTSNRLAIATTAEDVVLIKGGAVKIEHCWKITGVLGAQPTRDMLRSGGPELWGMLHHRFFGALS